MLSGFLLCLLFSFGWESFVANLPGELYRLSIFSYLQSIAKHDQVELSENRLLAFISGSMGSQQIGVVTAWVSMTGLIVGALALGCWWFGHFEYVPREDAE